VENLIFDLKLLIGAVRAASARSPEIGYSDNLGTGKSGPDPNADSRKSPQPMSRSDEIGKTIAAAAKAALLPLGCQRMGKSRSWFSDQRFWLITIEFQPSSWQKGTYLNVGAMWLWRARKGHAFNVGYRIADFIPFYSPEQFGPAAVSLAAKAAQEVQRRRKQFKTLHDIYRYLVDHTSEKNWQIFHAAIAAGLIGDADTARRLFQTFDAMPIGNVPWQIELRAKNAALAAQLDRPALFRTSVLEIIQECRLLNGLSADPGCLDDV
jgi:hypothetical protein